jgi:hypothetical protein
MPNHRHRLESAIYEATHKDYRSRTGGRTWILMLRQGATTLVPLDALSEPELQQAARNAGVDVAALAPKPTIAERPFRAVLRVPAPSRDFVSRSHVERQRKGRGAITRVRLPDGYVVSFVGAVGKIEAIRNALEAQGRGDPSEAPPELELRPEPVARILERAVRCTSCTHSRALHEGGRGACAHLSRKGSRLCDCRAFEGLVPRAARR